MAPACSVPGFLGEEGGGGGGGGGGGRGVQNGVLNLESLRMQSSVSYAKGSVGKKAAVAMSNSMGSSSIAYEGPDIADDDGDEETNSPSPAAAAAAAEREIPKVLAVLASVLERLVARNEQFANSSSPSQQVVFNPKKLTIFHGLRAPGISIAKYLERIFKYTSCSPSCFVVGYVFIDRLIHRQPDLLVTSLNVHRLLVTSVMVATKMLDDVHFNNAFFARVGGVSVVELNRLELEFLFRLDFRLSVTTSVFESYCSHLEKEVLAIGKKSECAERSLPTFGSVSTEVMASFHKKRVAAAIDKPQLNSSQLAVQYQQSIAKMMARESSFPSL